MRAGELLFGLVEENGGRAIATNLTVGQSVSIPQGLSHFAQNLGCETAQFLANFPNRDPGTQTELTALLRHPDVTLRGTFLLDDQVLDTIKEAARSQDNPSVEPECAKRCGIEVPGNGGGDGGGDGDGGMLSAPPEPAPTPSSMAAPTQSPM
jgi:Cupin